MSHRAGDSQRWLVSYADMVTLLFALFLVLFAVASVDNSRLKGLATALDQRLRQVEPAPVGPPPEPETFLASSNDSRARTLALLEDQLDGFEVTRTPQGIAVSLHSDGILFDSGQSELKPQAEAVLSDLQEIIENSPLSLRVEGHTDSQAIHTLQYQSNWELSVHRAWAVAKRFIEKGVDPDKISVMGYGAKRPVADNNSPEGRSKNRRVVLHFVATSEHEPKPTMPIPEAQDTTYGPRVPKDVRIRASRSRTSNSADTDSDGPRSDDPGADNLIHQDYSRPSSDSSGPGDAQHTSEHSAHPAGALLNSSVYGSNYGQSLHRSDPAFHGRQTRSIGSLSEGRTAASRIHEKADQDGRT